MRWGGFGKMFGALQCFLYRLRREPRGDARLHGWAGSRTAGFCRGLVAFVPALVEEVMQSNRRSVAIRTGYAAESPVPCHLADDDSQEQSAESGRSKQARGPQPFVIQYGGQSDFGLERRFPQLVGAATNSNQPAWMGKRLMIGC